MRLLPITLALAACDTRANPAFGNLPDAGAPPVDARPSADGTPADAPQTLDTGGGEAVGPMTDAPGAAELPPPTDASALADVASDVGSGVDALAAEGPPADTAPALRGECPADPDLALCLRFEKLVDDEAPRDIPITATNVVHEQEVDGQAARLTTSSKIQVAENAALAAAVVTIEAWVKPSALPGSGDRAAIVDYSRQYALVILPGGDLRCRVNAGASSYHEVTRSGLLKLNVWSSVACMASGGVLSLWHDGKMVQSANLPGSLVVRNTTEPFLIGSNFPTSANPDTDPLLGHIDNVRIWRRMRTADELCRAARGCQP